MNINSLDAALCSSGKSNASNIDIGLIVWLVVTCHVPNASRPSTIQKMPTKCIPIISFTPFRAFYRPSRLWHLRNHNNLFEKHIPGDRHQERDPIRLVCCQITFLVIISECVQTRCQLLISDGDDP
jgi:hypothetical protein